MRADSFVKIFTVITLFKVIGEIGPWQIEKCLIVFLVSIPGLAQIFLTAFLLPKTDFWCEDSHYADLDRETLKVSRSSLSFSTDWLSLRTTAL